MLMIVKDIAQPWLPDPWIAKLFLEVFVFCKLGSRVWAYGFRRAVPFATRVLQTARLSLDHVVEGG